MKNVLHDLKIAEFIHGSIYMCCLFRKILQGYKECFLREITIGVLQGYKAGILKGRRYTLIIRLRACSHTLILAIFTYSIV